MQKNNNMVKIQKLVVGSGEHDKKVVLGIAVKFADDFAFYDCAFGLFVLGPNIKVIPKYYKTQIILVQVNLCQELLFLHQYDATI